MDALCGAFIAGRGCGAACSFGVLFHHAQLFEAGARFASRIGRTVNARSESLIPWFHSNFSVH
jgi:hypothetical protein